MEVVDEKVLAAAASLGQLVTPANAKVSPLSSADMSMDLEDSSVDMPENSGKLKAQKYRKGE